MEPTKKLEAELRSDLDGQIMQLRDTIQRQAEELKQKNRELEIEAALERVRSRAIAMQKSDELTEVAALLFKQVSGLGIKAWTTGFNVWSDDNDFYTDFITNADGGFIEPYTIDLRHYPVFTQISDAKKRGDGYFVRYEDGEQLKETYRHLSKFGEQQFKALLNNGFQFPTKQYEHFVFGAKVSLMFITYEPVPEAHEIFKRFGKVFEQAYTRFLDLKKAEAQAREAQIEAALEKIRSRSLAMHQSNELKEVITVTFEKLKELNVLHGTVGIQLFDYETKDAVAWVGTTIQDPQMVNMPFDEQIMAGENFLSDTWKAMTNGVDIINKKYSLEQKNRYFRHLFAHNDFTQIPQSARDFLLQMNGHLVCFFTQKNSAFLVDSFDGELFSEESIDVIRRAVKVFEQAYIRFLDLKKAEALAREAEIELALERVRARTMAMKKQDDLIDVINLLAEQLLQLGFDLQVANFSHGINDTDWDLWIFSDLGNGVKVTKRIHFPWIDHPYFHRTKKALDRYRAGESDLSTEVFTKEEKDSWLDYCFELPEFKDVPPELKQPQYQTPGYSWSSILLKETWVAIGKYDTIPFTDEQNNILRKFANAFGQAYTRFLDLQKAEALAREAQIEAALERVRSRAMAMQSSEELNMLIGTVFSELTKLDLLLTRCVIWIFEPSTNSARWFLANQEQPSNPMNFYVKYHEHPAWLSFVNEWKKQTVSWVYDLHGQNKVSWDDILFNETELRNLPEVVKNGMRAPERVLLSASFNNFGGINAASLEPLSEEHFDILLRFAKVFDLTYTRFLDLKKAEAQAREAKIEAALERVRSRTMAMQKSGELKEVIQVVYEQFAQLNILIEHTGFIIDYKANDNMHIWLADQRNVPSRVTIPYFDSPHWNSFIDAKEKGKDFFANQLSFEEKNRFYQDLFKIIPGLTDETKEYYFNCPGLAISTVLLENVGLYIENFSGIPYTDEENNTLMRFGKVFQQTYTRFLDLQKAEAQTRESQIQLGLERVRARTMAMQRSDELAEVAALMFQQVKSLGVTQWVCGFNIWEIGDTKSTWYSGTPDGKINPPARFPLTEHPVFIAMDESRRRGDELFIYEKSGELQAGHYRYMMSLPVLGDLMQNYFDAGLTIPPFQIDHYANFLHGNLIFITYEHVPEMHDVFKRFAKVFDQTYTRFLDLQNAESQARESQIQLALERARAQSMTMQHSSELDDTLRVFHEQVMHLGIPSAFSFLWLPDEEKDRHIFWAAWAENNSTVFRSKAINFPLDRNEPATAQCLVDWKSNQPVISYHVPPAEVKNYFAAWQELFGGVQELKPENFSGGLYYVEAFLKYGCFGVMVQNEIHEDEKKILARFAIEFERTYTRFLDLQKAEAQAREAQIEAALEKVRSRSLAMHHSNELEQVVLSLFGQLEGLGLSFDGAIIYLFDKETRQIQLWIATRHLPAPVKIDLPHDEAIANNAFNVDLWHAIETGEHIFNKSYSGQAKNDYFRYVAKYNESRIPEHIRQLHIEKESWSLSLAAGKNSAVGFDTWSDHKTTTDDFQTLLRFSRVFEQAYTRFLDLQKSEAQAKEAQIEAALERVRSRTLAMQKSDELAATASVLFNQLIHLGIEARRLYINIIKDETGIGEFWITDEDGSKVTTAYSADLNANATFKKILEGWKSQKKSIIIDIQGTELEEYFQHLSSLKVVRFKSRPEQKRRLQYIAYFSKGFIGMASPEEQPAETLQLLERFASSFNLTVTRFNDLKIAEAHALQAEQDLKEIKAAKQNAEDALAELQVTQKQLIQSEKMASLGELTAGIAHEIQNPLNFVNNFSDVSNELLDEMIEQLAVIATQSEATGKQGNVQQAMALANDVRQNLEKINHHGKRADAIVKGMLQHSRTSSGQKEPTDINALCDEYLRLAYHGLRAKDKSFNAKFETDFDNTIGKIDLIPQDIGRAILNIINNAFYAVKEKTELRPASVGYEPRVVLTTKKAGDEIEIRIRDNGIGIPQKALDKIFQPFFTTKPTGQGTGLGLSLAYDIVTNGHGGELTFVTKEGEGTEFIIELPRGS